MTPKPKKKSLMGMAIKHSERQREIPPVSLVPYPWEEDHEQHKHTTASAARRTD